MSTIPKNDLLQNKTDQTMSLGTQSGKATDNISQANDTISSQANQETPHNAETIAFAKKDSLSTSEEKFVEETIVTGSGAFEQKETNKANETMVRGGGITAPVGTPTKAVKTPGELTPGETFQGKYEVIKLLGAGGMGRVYQARHIDLDKMVAIKVLSANLSQDQEAVERFKREAKATAKVTHPNAVQVLDYGVDSGNCFLVMEFLEGESLRERLAKQKTLSLKQVVSFTEQICYVLEVMHRKGITHRDLKPDNIFFQQQEDIETVKVLDFGIAKIHSNATQAGNELTHQGMMIGTPRYMSPEQCQGAAIDGRSDLYSLSVVIYEMLAGKVPFDAENPFTIALKHINTPLPSILDFVPDLLPSVAEVIHKALSKNPNDRYQTARELAQAMCQAAHIAPTVQMEAPVSIKSEASADEVELIKTSTTRNKISEIKGETLPLSSVNISAKTSWGKYAAAAIVVITLIIGARLTGLWPSRQVVIPTPSPTPTDNTPPSLKNFVLIPAGKFTMGFDLDDNQKTQDNRITSDETPAHEVNLESYYLSKYETTNAEYKEFIEAKKYHTPKTWKESQFPPGEEKYPVVNISLEDAEAYCQWRSERDGIKFRLPTEEEWEFAARGSDGRTYPWGMRWNEDLANCNKESEKSSALEVDSSSSKILGDKSPHGIIAMAGNVLEWTSSKFKPYSGSSYSPTSKDLECFIYRGGGFNSSKFEARTTSRKWTTKDKSYEYLGFRLAADPK